MAPTVIAHRGASRAHPPGNTLAAFRAAAPLGATWVELDVHLCRDGSLVVHHDATLANGTVLSDSPRDALPGWIPDLTGVLDACAGIGVNIEIKHLPGEPDEALAVDATAAVVTLLDARRARESGDRILISSFDPRTVGLVRTLDGTIDTAQLLLDPSAAAVTAAADAGCTAIHPWDAMTTPDVVASAQSQGLRVNVWTVNDPDRMRALRDMGVDGIVTDAPDVAVRAIEV